MNDTLALIGMLMMGILGVMASYIAFAEVKVTEPFLKQLSKFRKTLSHKGNAK